MENKAAIPALAVAVMALLTATTVVFLMRPEKSPPDTAPRESQVQTDFLRVFNHGYPTSTKVEALSTELVRIIVGANETLYLRCTDRASGISHELYIVYWRAGNAYCYEAERHSPDSCWISVGWTCLESKSPKYFRVGSETLGPFNWRRYVAPNSPPQEVLFWCLNGKIPVSIGLQNSNAGDRASLMGAIEHSVFLNFWAGHGGVQDPTARRIASPSKGDVYFIRINSTHKFEELAKSSAFQHQAKLLFEYGLLPSR